MIWALGDVNSNLNTISLSLFLSSYTHYKQRPIPITDILSLTLGFVRDQTTWECGVEEGDQQAEKRARVSLHPSPRYRSEQELKVMEACLSRWSKELKQDMDGEGGGLHIHTYL